MKNAFCRPGKIMEFEKKGQNHGISKYPYGKIMEKDFGAPHIPSNLTHCLGYYNCYNFYHDCWMWL